jgi:hypothetical protein
MIDDFKPPTSRKPKVIQPLAKPIFKPLPQFESIDDAKEDTGTDGQQFKPVDEVESTPLAAALKSDNVAAETANVAAKPLKTNQKFWQRWHLGWPHTRKQYAILAAVIVVLVAGSGAVWAKYRNTATAKPLVATHHIIVKKPVVPTTVASTLSGLQVAPEVNQRPVTAVMIENSIDARPQSGLDQAGVVFEAIAEGGVTRFMALFQDTQPDYIGPVRSARPYYIQWSLGFDAGYAHVGGSPDGLADIKAWGVRDLDQFANSGAYQRISSRYAPHNVYTSIAKLNTLEQAKGYTSSSFTGFARKAELPYKAPATVPATSSSPTKKTTTTKSKTPTDTRTPATSIDMALSGYYYNPHYDYDASTNTYKRSEDGTAHLELSSSGAQTQIAPKVVIGIVVPLGQGVLDSSGAYYSNYNPIGSGQAYIFQDGTITTGTWAKSENKSQISFTDASGKVIPLDAGQTWITAVSATNQVTYK